MHIRLPLLAIAVAGLTILGDARPLIMEVRRMEMSASSIKFTPAMTCVTRRHLACTR
jgi:hypothetical protein